MKNESGASSSTNCLEQIIALVGLTALGVIATLPPDSLLWLRVVSAVIAMGTALWPVHQGNRPGGAVALLVSFIGLMTGLGLLWPVVMWLSLLAYIIVTKQFPNFGIREGWTVGTLPWGPTAICAGVAPVGLVSWVFLMQPDLDDLTKPVSQFSLPVLVAGGIIFVFLNAAGEELIWRGVFLQSLRPMFCTHIAIILQGLSFGVMHAHGFPRGVVGICLAGFWGLLQGWLRDRSGGLLAPILAHIMADVTIAIIVYVLA